MKKLMLILCATAVVSAITGTAKAAPITLINQGDTWSYYVITTHMPNFYSADYSSFDWESATWLTGQAAFGNTLNDRYSLPYNNEWLEGTYLALSKTVNINGIFTSDLTLNVASDNGFIFFVNGEEVIRYWASGYTSYWEYTMSVNPSFFSQGLNTVSVLAQDQGGVTFFDMELYGDLQPVLEPNISVLPLSHDFGEAEMGSSSTTILSISNNGDADLTVDDISLQSGLCEDFTVALVTLPLVIPLEGTEEVEITYSPSAVGPCSGVLEITSDDPDEPVVEVELRGIGIEPASPTIDDILGFFDASVAEGTLYGQGRPWLAKIRLARMRFMLKFSAILIKTGNIELACWELQRAHDRCDEESPPPDFVEGPATEELAEVILDLMENLGGE